MSTLPSTFFGSAVYERHSAPLSLSLPLATLPKFAFPSRDDEYLLLQTKICRLKLLSHQTHPSEGSSISPSKGLIVRFGESRFRPPHELAASQQQPLISRITIEPFLKEINCMEPNFPRTLNLMDFRIVELIETYTLNYNSYQQDSSVVPVIRKALLVPTFPGKGCMIFVLSRNGWLGFHKIGKENWNIMNDGGNMRYDDIMLKVGPSLSRRAVDTVQLSWPKAAAGWSRAEVSMWLICIFLRAVSITLKFKKFMKKSKGEDGLRVKNLGDVVLVLTGESNFSMSAYHGWRGNCIYFHDEVSLDYVPSAVLRCFSLENRGFC